MCRAAASRACPYCFICIGIWDRVAGRWRATAHLRDGVAVGVAGVDADLAHAWSPTDGPPATFRRMGTDCLRTSRHATRVPPLHSCLRTTGVTYAQALHPCRPSRPMGGWWRPSCEAPTPVAASSAPATPLADRRTRLERTAARGETHGESHPRGGRPLPPSSRAPRLASISRADWWRVLDVHHHELVPGANGGGEGGGVRPRATRRRRRR